MKLQVVFACALALLVAVVQAQSSKSIEWHDFTSDAFHSAYDSLVADGYRLTYVSGYSLNDEALFAAIWEQESGVEWIAQIGMTDAKYQEYTDAYKAQGYRAVIVNGYSVKNENYYVAIWDKSPSGDWVAKHGLNASAYQTAFDTWVSQGYKMRHISAYSLDTIPIFAAIWEETSDGVEWASKIEMSSSEYLSDSRTYVSQGYRPLVLSGCQINGEYYYAAIWDKSPISKWAEGHELPTYAYQKALDSFVSQGFTLKLVNGYGGAPSGDKGGGGNRYAAIWEQS